MKVTILLFLFLSCTLIVSLAWGVEENTSKDKEVPPKNAEGETGQKNTRIAVPKDIVEAVSSESRILKYYYAPELSEGEEVDKRQVPEELRMHVQTWSERIVRSQWLVEGLVENLKGRRCLIPLVPPSEVDLLYAEFNASGSRVRLVEAPGFIHVLWHNADIQIGPDPEKTVRFLSTCLLQLPDEKIRKFEIFLREVKLRDKQSLYIGTMRLIEKAQWKSEKGWYNDKDGLIVEEREWYHEIRVWVAPEFFYAGVFERKPGKYNPQAAAGSPQRFLDKVPEEKPEE